MPSNTELVAIARQYLYANYQPAPFAFVRGRGCELFDAEGRRFLDLCGGIAVCAVGHGHPTLARAIGEQAATLMHVSNYFYNEPNIRLAEALCRRAGLARAFFCNSGTEANEAMLKLARHHFFLSGKPERIRIVAFQNAFHGRTLGALSMTGTPKLPRGLRPARPDDARPLQAIHRGSRARQRGPDVCAIIVEPLQGEGGVMSAPPGFLAALRTTADAHGALLLVDEVQTGVGRLGSLSSEAKARAANPDAVALAKGLAGGFPDGRDAHDQRRRRRTAAPAAMAAPSAAKRACTSGGGSLVVLRITVDSEERLHRGAPEPRARRWGRCSARWRAISPTSVKEHAERGFCGGSFSSPGSSLGKCCHASRRPGFY